ncbi:hypothetical protein V7S43_016812 [Phytophthora oleae]|uniref:WRKY transcription factor 19 n=1 Tax=Phytophthora oleae TaxID=2107226 RepID=A0ABD3EV54_9STRA
MLDVTSVGANLTVEQREAILADLTFFLDNYGSTRAVRAKLKEQQREIQRLIDRLQQLLNGCGGKDSREDERQAAANEELFDDDVGDADETMADVDFFLRVYGSTHAVRQELSVQRNKIEVLNKAIVNFQKQPELQDENVCETQEFNGASGNNDLGGENDVQMESAGVVTQDIEKHADESSQSRSVDCRRLSHSTCNEGPSEYCAVHRRVAAASRHGGAREEEAGSGGHCDHGDMQTKVVPIQSQKELKASADSKETPHEFVGFVVHPVWLLSMDTTAYQQVRSTLAVIPNAFSSNHNSKLREPTTSHVESTEDSSTAAKQTDSIRETPSSPRSSSQKCRHRDCNKLTQAHGLCYAHGGYNICKVDDCERRATARKLCRYHGGGTQCKMSECEKLGYSTWKGYCYRHAREQGILVNHAKESNVPQVEKSDGSGNGVIDSQTQAKPDSEIPTQSLDNDGDIHTSNRGTRVSDSNIRCESHVVCKVHKCMKWAMRDGDQSEYCFLHKRTSASQDNTQGPSTSSVPPVSEAEANAAKIMTDNSCKHRHSICNEAGCERIGKPNGAKKGYCFKHGGGVPCQYPGCTKQPQFKGLCAAHGGFRICKTEGCSKHVFQWQLCFQHYRVDSDRTSNS